LRTDLQSTWLSTCWTCPDSVVVVALDPGVGGAVAVVALVGVAPGVLVGVRSAAGGAVAPVGPVVVVVRFAAPSGDSAGDDGREAPDPAG
jgi:hypothetical protein